MIIAVRGALFQAAFYLWTTLLAILYLPLLVAPRGFVQKAVRFWLAGVLVLARVICGLRWKIIGLEHIEHVRNAALVVAAKHQSAWETMIFHQLLADPVFAVKRELFAVPLFGWYMQKVGCIRIDRASRVRALRSMVEGAVAAVAAGRQVIVFPEGTRVAPGVAQPYHAGIAAIYDRIEAPVVPVALNSGVFWGRRRLRKYPGMITLEILPPMPSGLDRRTFLHELRQRIEGASQPLYKAGLEQLRPEWRAEVEKASAADGADRGATGIHQPLSQNSEDGSTGAARS